MFSSIQRSLQSTLAFCTHGYCTTTLSFIFKNRNSNVVVLSAARRRYKSQYTKPPRKRFWWEPPTSSSSSSVTTNTPTTKSDSDTSNLSNTEQQQELQNHQRHIDHITNDNDNDNNHSKDDRQAIIQQQSHYTNELLLDELLQYLLPHQQEKLSNVTVTSKESNLLEEHQTDQNLPPPVPSITRSQVHRMRVPELIKELEIRNLQVSGKKPDLVKRLMSHLFDSSQPTDAATSTTTPLSENTNEKASSKDDTKVIDALNISPISSDNNDTVNALEEPAKTEMFNPNHTYYLYVKGLSSPNRNSTGVGIVIKNGQDDNVELHVQKHLPFNRSTFEADYLAIIIALKYAQRRNAQHLHLYIDQDVIYQQLHGWYKVRRKTLVHSYWQIMRIRESLASLEVHLINKEDNALACEMALKALATGKSTNITEADYDAQKEEPRPGSLKGVDIPSVMGSVVKKKDKDGNHSSDQEEQTEEQESSEPKTSYISSLPNNTLNPTILSTLQKPTIDSNETYLMQFDGGARGNPHGCSGVGVVLYNDKDEEIWCAWQFLGTEMSNNAAEYHALILGLNCAHALGIRKLRAQGDSELIVKQLKGTYRCRHEGLQVLLAKAIKLKSVFEDFDISHIKRNRNTRADWLANNAMNNKHSYGLEVLQNNENVA